MISLSISGRSEGMVAASNIDLFLTRDESLTELLSERLDHAAISLPFEVLSVFVDAKPHDAPAKPAHASKAIRVRSNRKLMRYKTGQAMKSFDLILDNDNFYSLPKPGKHEAIAAAFKGIAVNVLKEFKGQSGAALAHEIVSAAQDYLARQRSHAAAPSPSAPCVPTIDQVPHD